MGQQHVGASATINTDVLFKKESIMSVTLISTATDAGNTPTSELRGGVALGKITASGLWTVCSHGAADGSEVCRAFLYKTTKLTDEGGTVRNTVAEAVYSGELNEDRVTAIMATAQPLFVVATAKTNTATYAPGIQWMSPDEDYFPGAQSGA